MSSGSVTPLEGITVVDLTQVQSGPFASQMLGDLGAEVLKIEAVKRGDLSRGMSVSNRGSEYFDVLNRNKQSIAIDLKDERGQEVVHSMLEDANVFIENAKPGSIEKFNLTYEQVAEVNSEIIYCSIAGFEAESEYGHIPAWDMLIQGMSGMMGITGEKEGGPLWSGLPIGDLAASLYAANSITTALYATEKGELSGEHIEVPMLDSLMSLLTTRAAHSFVNHEPFPRLGTYHPGLAPFGIYDTADGQIVIAAGSQGLWPSFCRGLEREGLIEDERFDSVDNRLENRAELRAIIQELLLEHTAEEWQEIMFDESVPVGKIQDTHSVWEDDYVQHRQLHQSIERTDGKEAHYIRSPPIFSTIADDLRSPPPVLGEHTDSILEQNGYTDDQITALREAGVVE